MPAAPDHWRFCLAVLGESGEDASGAAAVLPVDYSGPEILGTQGPDPFYFYGLVPWRFRRDKGRAKAFADWLHDSPPQEVFLPLLRAALEIPSSAKNVGPGQYGEGRGLALRFLTGLLFHFALDRAVHPWVYWNSGFSTVAKPDSGASVRHARFEAALDAFPPGPIPNAVVDLVRHSSPGYRSIHPGFPSRPTPSLMFRSRPAILLAADRLFAAAFPDRCRPGMYGAAWKDMATVLKFLWDPSGVKRRLIETLGGTKALPRAMMQPVFERELEGIDYRNEGEAEWFAPATGERRHESVRSLTGAAVLSARAAVTLINRIESVSAGRNSPGYVSDSAESLETLIAEFTGFLGTVNHEGCLPGETMKYRKGEGPTFPAG